MKEILFRGKRIDNNEWTYGFYSQFHNRPICDEPNSHQIFELNDEGISFAGTSIGGFWRIINKNTLGQYTGLVDKNGTKVFEGDIVKVYSDCDGYYTEKQYLNGVILFDEEYFFEYEISFNHIRCCCEENIGNHRDNIEVIGNIYDNKELLEENK